MQKTVGEFSLTDGVLSGPYQYMVERGNALVDRMMEGEDQVFNLTESQSPDVETAILVRLQTDYAGWVGLKQAERWLEEAE